MQETPTLTRQQKIKRILERRNPIINRLEEVKKSASVLLSLLNELNKQKNNLTQKYNFTESKDLGSFNPSGIIVKLQEQISEIDKLKKRFDRDKIYIGVVGQARQGKSRLLRSVTGLSRDEIPDGNEGYCTGVRSTIINEPSEEPYAEIYFYSSDEFTDEVIGAYYQKLALGSNPKSIDDFKMNIPPAPQNLGPKLATMYTHLKEDYHKHIDLYSSRFMEASPKHIRSSEVKKEVKKFVSQYDQQSKEKYFDYLAVKEAKIYCKFPRSEDFGEIVLVDLPGLGDTRVGDEERLAKTLKDEVDFVLFVRRPDGMGDDWNYLDQNVYQLVYDQFTDLSRRSFMILNRTEYSQEENTTDNLSACERFKNNLNKKSIETQECMITDCSNQEDVGEVLDKILEYLVDDITFLDENYAQPYQDNLVKIKENIQTQLLQGEVTVNTLQNVDALFQRELFPKLWRDLNNELEELLKNLYSKRSKQDPTFKTKVQEAIAACREDVSAIATIDEIKSFRNQEGSYKIAYLKCLVGARSNLLKHFLKLDIQMQKLLESVKEQIVDILKTQGKLQGLVSAQKHEFLTSLEKLIEVDSDFKIGVHTLSRFNIPLERGINSPIRQHIDALAPDRNDFPSRRLFRLVIEDFVRLISEKLVDEKRRISLTDVSSRQDELKKSLQHIEDIFSDSSYFNMNKTIEIVIQFFTNYVEDNEVYLADLQPLEKFLDLSYTEIIKEEKIYELLSARYNDVVNKCEKTLLLASNTPNEVAFDMVEIFIQLALRSNNSKLEWQIFLNKHRDEIWDEFRRMKVYKEETEKWLLLISNAKLETEKFFVKFLA
jgi:hypothetical protein